MNCRIALAFLPLSCPDIFWPSFATAHLFLFVSYGKHHYRIRLPFSSSWHGWFPLLAAFCNCWGLQRICLSYIPVLYFPIEKVPAYYISVIWIAVFLAFVHWEAYWRLLHFQMNEMLDILCSYIATFGGWRQCVTWSLILHYFDTLTITLDCPHEQLFHVGFSPTLSIRLPVMQTLITDTCQA